MKDTDVAAREPQTAQGQRIIRNFRESGAPGIDPMARWRLRETLAAIAELEDAALARRDAEREIGALRSALAGIAEAKRRREPCPTPGNCMIPQAHVDDETWVEFADRLQREAATVLRDTAAAAAARDERPRVDVERLRAAIEKSMAGVGLRSETPACEHGTNDKRYLPAGTPDGDFLSPSDFADDIAAAYNSEPGDCVNCGHAIAHHDREGCWVYVEQARRPHGCRCKGWKQP